MTPSTTKHSVLSNILSALLLALTVIFLLGIELVLIVAAFNPRNQASTRLLSDNAALIWLTLSAPCFRGLRHAVAEGYWHLLDHPASTRRA